MFFLVPYNIVDRDDISVNQKMIAIYLARIQDERGPNASPSMSEIASKLKISEEEVGLSMELLLSKGILSADQVEIREAGFNDITEYPSTDDTAKTEEEHKTGHEPENISFILEAMESAEERVRERAAQLKLNVRKKKRALNQAQAMSELEKAAERLKEEEAEGVKPEKRSADSDEVDELLRLLQSGPKEAKQEDQNLAKADKEERRVKNRNFMKVSSVYNSVKSSLPKNKIDEKTPK